jgi:hypothetical protein
MFEAASEDVMRVARQTGSIETTAAPTYCFYKEAQVLSPRRVRLAPRKAAGLSSASVVPFPQYVPHSLRFAATHEQFAVQTQVRSIQTIGQFVFRKTQDNTRRTP